MLGLGALGFLGGLIFLVLLVVNKIRKKPLKKFAIGLGVCFAVFVISITAAIISTRVTVEDFSAMDKVAIQDWAETNNIVCVIEEAYSDSVADGSFISQSVSADTVIREEDTITVVFSLGEQPVTPDFSTMDKAAIEDWSDANDVRCIFKEEYSDSVADGSFISQSISADTLVTRNDKITIVFSLGKQPVAPDFSKMSKAAIQSWSDKNDITCIIEDEYSNSIADGSFISQSISANTLITTDDTITIVFSMGKEPTAEYINALRKAEIYSETLYMSKRAIYDQLVSSYGEDFPPDAAQYAIDHIQADWKANALEKAKVYYETMAMSKNAIYDQLISNYGEQFTKEEAQYAIDHLDD